MIIKYEYYEPHRIVVLLGSCREFELPILKIVCNEQKMGFARRSTPTFPNITHPDSKIPLPLPTTTTNYLQPNPQYVCRVTRAVLPVQSENTMQSMHTSTFSCTPQFLTTVEGKYVSVYGLVRFFSRVGGMMGF
jgi:hypothetical protein